jgi:hypothetical protein
MGIVIDITDKLNAIRRSRRLVKDIQRSDLRIAYGLLLVTKREVERQMLILCDKNASKADVEEAIELMPLLTEILGQRQREYRCLEADLIANGDTGTHDD